MANVHVDSQTAIRHAKGMVNLRCAGPRGTYEMRCGPLPTKVPSVPSSKCLGLEVSGLILLIALERLCARVLRRMYGNDGSRARNNEDGAGL